MKTRTFAAAGALVLAALTAVPTSGASAVSYNYGSRDTPLGAVAGGARFGAVVGYQPVGRSTKASMDPCSTGVPWRLANGTRGFLTAGHCLPSNGPGATQMVRSRSGALWVPGPPLGIRKAGMTTTNWGAGTIPGKIGDLAFVPSMLPVGNYLFDGAPSTRSLLRISSWTSKAAAGSVLCFSGHRTGSRCGLRPGNVTSYRSRGGTFTGMAEAVYGWGSPSQSCGDGGDSGGAVYRMSPDRRSAYVVGIISGARTQALRSMGCSLYYTPLGAAQKQFGGAPITS